MAPGPQMALVQKPTVPTEAPRDIGHTHPATNARVIHTLTEKYPAAQPTQEQKTFLVGLFNKLKMSECSSFSIFVATTTALSDFAKFFRLDTNGARDIAEAARKKVQALDLEKNA